MAGHGGWPVLAHNLWARHPGVARGTQHAVLGTERRGGQQGRRGLSQPGQGSTWQRFDKVQVHGTIMSVAPHANDPKQVYLGARYDGEVFGTQDGGESWQSMPLPQGVKDIYAWRAASGTGSRERDEAISHRGNCFFALALPMPG